MFAPPSEALPERTRHPEKGVQSEEGKGAEQQPGHAPERVVKIGILFTIVMGGMGQISGEFPVGAGMALPAGFNDIVPMQPRFGIVSRQDIMRPMAIGTFGGFFAAGQQGRLAMIGIKIGFCFMLVTSTAFLQNQTPERSLVHPTDRM